MSKENDKKTSNKKKNNTKKVTDTNLTKATKKENKNKEKTKESKILILDNMEEAMRYDDDLNEIVPEKSSKKKTKSENIEHIEKIAKNKKKNTKKDNKLSNVIEVFNKYRYPIYSFIAGVLITVLIAFIIWPERIAALKNGEEPVVKVDKNTYTADTLYTDMKNYYSVSLLLDKIDTDILTKMYPEDDEMTKEVNSNAEYYLNTYKQYYNMTEEQFLKQNGFANYNAFLDYLKLDNRRNKYLDDYLKEKISDNEIEKYYNENVFGDINTEHVLVEISSSEDDGKLSDEDAKKLAEEIITKLNDGTKWNKIKEEYKDKITYEDLSYQSWDASLEESFMTALKGMEENTYSEEPVKTSYGYHVIYRKDQKKTPSLKKSTDKIVEKIIAAKKSEDQNLLYKALIHLRDEKKIDFKDTNMKSKYDTYCDQYK